MDKSLDEYLVITLNLVRALHGEEMMVLVVEDKCPHCKAELEIIICEVGKRSVTVKACPTGVHYYTTLIQEKPPTER